MSQDKGIGLPFKGKRVVWGFVACGRLEGRGWWLGVRTGASDVVEGRFWRIVKERGRCRARARSGVPGMVGFLGEHMAFPFPG